MYDDYYKNGWGGKVSMREEWKEKASHTGMNEWIKLH